VIISFHIDRCDRNTHHSTDNLFAISLLSRQEEDINGKGESKRLHLSVISSSGFAISQ